MILRRDELCLGDDCEDAKREPNEYGTLLCVERCATCPADGLDRSLSDTTAGELAIRVVNIDFTSESHITQSLDDISAREHSAFKILKSEKVLYQQEQAQRRDADAKR